MFIFNFIVCFLLTQFRTLLQGNSKYQYMKRSSSAKNSEDHPDHNDNVEDTDTPYFKLFNTFNILNI
jgi:hypothetical protein